MCIRDSLHVYRSALQGMGDTIVPMLSGFIEMLMRIGSAVFLPAYVGQDGVFLAEVIAWTGAAVLLIVKMCIRDSFGGDPMWITESLGGVGEDGRPLVTKNCFRMLQTLYNLNPVSYTHLSVRSSRPSRSSRTPSPFKAEPEKHGNSCRSRTRRRIAGTQSSGSSPPSR